MDDVLGVKTTLNKIMKIISENPHTKKQFFFIFQNNILQPPQTRSLGSKYTKMHLRPRLLTPVFDLSKKQWEVDAEGVRIEAPMGRGVPPGSA